MENIKQTTIRAGVVSGHPETWALIVKCVDSRLAPTLGALYKIMIEHNLTKAVKNPTSPENILELQKHTDLLTVAGGPRDLARDGSNREYLLGQIGALIELHNPPVIILITHGDCGAYKYANEEPTDGDWLKLQRTDLQKASEELGQFGKPVLLLHIDHAHNIMHLV